MIESGSIQENLDKVLGRIGTACAASQRDAQDVLLVAVSKKQPVEKIQEFLLLSQNYSQRIVLGENYVQEWRKKVENIGEQQTCHLIGPLQSNKIKHAVRLFEIIQSVHSVDLLNEIARQAITIGKTQRVYLQVNISSDAGKSGFSEKAVKNFFEQSIQSVSGISIEGLMTITAFYENSELVRPDFEALKDLALGLESQYADKIINPRRPGKLELSMGMSADYEIAIAAGATVVRVGTAIFGERPLDGSA